MKKQYLIGAVIVLVGVAALTRRWWLKSTEEVAVLAAGPAPAQPVPDSSVVLLTGHISAGGNEPLAIKRAGRVRNIYFAAGEYVRTGAVLVKMANYDFVVAPHGGFMSERQVAVGQYLPRATKVASISKRPYLLVPVALPTSGLARVQPGDSVRVWATARPTRVVTGVVGPTAADSLEIRLPSRAPLRIGESATVQLKR